MMMTFVRSLATNAKFNIREPPKYTLGSLRSFPSLEPHQFIPLPADFLDAPKRRDFLWSSVVYEADNSRVGSGNVTTRGDQPFSHKKLRPQKGSGMARTGDANSPHRYNSIKAHGIKAPHDWSTKLPHKVYSKAFATAFSEQYKQGRVFIVGGDQTNEGDKSILDFDYKYPETLKQFVTKHQLKKMNLLFITDEQRTNLLEAADTDSKKIDVLVKESLQVRDVLRANRIYIELPALQWLIGNFQV